VYRGARAEERITERRKRLIDAGVEIFGTSGYRTATVESICARAGLTKRYFYESFTDSQALFLVCYRRSADEIHEALVRSVAGAPANAVARLRAAVEGYFGAIDADPRRARITLVEVLGISADVTKAYRAQTERFAGSIEALGADTFARSKLSRSQFHLVALGVLGAVTTIATQWLLSDRTPSRQQVVAATNLIVSAILYRIDPNSPAPQPN
jgi:AcrR family transcriptional regulator